MTESEKIKPTVFLLFVGFALGSWLDINAIFSQMAIISSNQPEGTQLMSLLSLLIQLANISPLIYTIARNYCKRYVHEAPVIYFILASGSILLFILAFVYDKTIKYTSSYESSVPLLVITFFLAFVDVTSTVTFLPYMALYPVSYLAPFFIGQSLSSIIPSALSLIQSTESQKVPCSERSNYTLVCPLQDCYSTTYKVVGKHFSSRVYFLCMTFFMFISFICFLIIHRSKLVKKQRIRDYRVLKSEYNVDTSSNKSSTLTKVMAFIHLESLEGILLSMVAWGAFLSNGVMVQVLPYAAFPFGGLTYHCANNLYMASSAITSLLMMWKPKVSQMVLGIYTTLATLMVVFIVIIGLVHHKILTNSPRTLVKILLIFAAFLFGHFTSTVRQSVSARMSEVGSDKMFLCGVSIQIGSLIGTVVTFLLSSVGCVFN